MRTNRTLLTVALCLLVCLSGPAAADPRDDSGRLELIEPIHSAMAGTEVAATPDLFDVSLICTDRGWYTFAHECVDEVIQIPRGRPIYALLVSGFDQNHNFDRFHFYNFAKCLLEQGAYVHYAWWNNLLAPYMERPLHHTYSVPSYYASPYHDLEGYYGWRWLGYPYPDKALPADDDQFQLDAVTLLMRIHEENPDAVIVLAGHSMGGAAVAKLAAYTSMWLPDIEIALLAPIDPVGNKTCLPDSWHPTGKTCQGYNTFTRFHAVRWDTEYQNPPKLILGENVKNLYHRWQWEYLPPFDSWPLLLGSTANHYFEFENAPQWVTSIAAGSPNVQAMVPTSGWSGYDVYPAPSIPNSGGLIDGHGEIVGFRGVAPNVNVFAGAYSYPMALGATGDWPSRDQETDLNNPLDPIRLWRVGFLKAWEVYPDYLEIIGCAPMAPDLCMVSDDMCTILETKVDLPTNLAPIANAGPDQTVPADDDCMGQVALDGSGSIDPDGDDLTYLWTWNDGASDVTGPNPTIELPPGSHEITLVVSDGELDSAPDTVLITVIDVTAPVMELEGSADMVLECAVDTWVDPGASATDNCDPDVAVSIGGDTVDPAVPGTYTITYDAVDASGNAATQVIRTVVVQDTLPPVFDSVTSNPATLWPPNHSMVSIQLTVAVHDSCDTTPNILLMEVTSDEPDDAQGGGDGHTTGDIQGADIGTEDYSILLRAERQGGGDGRVYTIVYSATDDSGNSAGSGTVVTVRHDSGEQFILQQLNRKRMIE